MRRQALIAGMMGALGALGMAPQMVAGGSAIAISAPHGNSQQGKVMPTGAQISRRAERFVGGRSSNGIEEPRYRKRPFHTVAQDKRDATKKRNQRRNKQHS